MYRVGDTVSDKVMALQADSILKSTEAQNQHAVHQELAQCGRSGRRHWHPLQHSRLENPMGGGAWWAAVYGVAQSRTRLKRLSSSSIRQNKQTHRKRDQR